MFGGRPVFSSSTSQLNMQLGPTVDEFQARLSPWVVGVALLQGPASSCSFPQVGPQIRGALLCVKDHQSCGSLPQAPQDLVDPSSLLLPVSMIPLPTWSDTYWTFTGVLP